MVLEIPFLFFHETKERRQYLDNILNRPGPFMEEEAASGDAVVELLSNARILYAFIATVTEITTDTETKG